MRKYRLEDKEMSLIKKMEFLAGNMENVVSFSQGIPDYPMPDKLKKEVSKLVLDGKANKYTQPNGILDLRKKLSNINNNIFNENEIIITAGAIEAINAFLLTILNNKEDEVIILDPSYASYNNAIKIAGGKIIYCPLKEDLNLNIKKLESLINKNTKAIIICNPNNPTGAIIEQEKIIEILEYIKNTDIYLVIDEVYEHFILEEKLNFESSINLFKKYKTNLLIINSWSKTFSITGWRIGYMIAEEKLIQEVLKIHDSLVTCAPSIAQYGVLNTINIIPEWTSKIIVELKYARDIVIKELSKMSDYIEFKIPKAGYYIFCKFKYTDDDYNECINILNKAKVSMVPGSAFGNKGKGYFRICFGRNLEILKIGLKRLEKYFKDNKKS